MPSPPRLSTLRLSSKSELDAAKEIVKKCKKAQDKLKSKSAEKVELEHTEDLAKELKTSLEKNLKSCQALKALTDGGMDETEIERLATAAIGKGLRRTAKLRM